MPELTAVETPKNAGFVQPKGGSRANKKRIEQDEAELKALMEAGPDGQQESNGEGSATTQVQTEGSSQQKEANSEAEAQEENLSGEERTYKKRYSDLRNHLNKQA